MIEDNKHNSGFSLLMIFIAIAAMLLIGFAGGVIYKNREHKTTNISDSTSKTTNPTTKSTTKSTAQTAQTAQQYVEITQWGVEAPYSGNLQLSYTMSSDGTTAAFSSTQLSALSSDCVGRGGAIERWASTDQVSNGYPATSSSPTAAQAFASADPSTYAHIGNYYYAFKHDQAACGDPNTTSSTYSQTNNAVQALIPNLG
jgi:hypothetical protein